MPAVLVTITMGEFKRRSKHPAQAGSATATAVVSAIGQRVQDSASFFAINAAIQQKQQAFVVARKLGMQALRDKAPARPCDVAAEGWDSLISSELTAEGTTAQDGQTSHMGARAVYIDTMSEVRMVRFKVWWPVRHLPVACPARRTLSETKRVQLVIDLSYCLQNGHH